MSTALVPVPQQIMSPSQLKLITGLGQLFAQSGFFTDIRQAAQGGVKILAGYELGFGAFASMTGLYIVKGRVTLSANLMAAKIRSSGRYDFRIREHTNKVCKIEFFGPAIGKPGTMESMGFASFTEEDAKLAGLITGENWKKYPKNMMYARALSNGAKWYCPDVFSGHTPYLPDEVTAEAKVLDSGEYVVPESELSAPSVSPGDVVSPKQGELLLLISETGADVKLILDYYKVDGIAKMDDIQCDNAIHILKQRKAATATATAA